MTEKVWFSQSIEGLFVRGVGEAMTPALRTKLFELGIDLTKLVPGYANDVVIRAIHLTAATLYPEQSEADQLRSLGVLFMKGYASTFIGAAMVQLMKVIGPRRSLERMERNFRTGGNSIETRFTQLAERKAQVWFNDVNEIPEFYAGIIARGGELAGAKEMSVIFAQPEPPSCTFTIEWSE